MQTVYKNCDNCDGTGGFYVTRKTSTTWGDYKEYVRCRECGGTGRIETEYFVDEDWQIGV